MTQISLSQFLEAKKFKIKVFANSNVVSDDTLFSGLQMATFLLYIHMTYSQSMHVEGEGREAEGGRRQREGKRGRARGLRERRK